MAIDIIGWVGTLLVLIAYFLVTNKKIKPEGIAYNSLNLIGAFGIGANVFVNHAWPSVGLNLVWCTIAVVALAKNFKNSKVQSRQ